VRRLRLVVRPEEVGASPSRVACDRGELTKAEFARLLASGAVSVNRRRLNVNGPALKLRDELVVVLEERGRTAREPLPIDAAAIVFRDARVVVVDKPSGLPAQGTPGDARAGLDTATGLLLAQLAGVGASGASVKVGIVHRLDVETSGLTVLALDDDAVRALSTEFREGRVGKRYLALVQGRPAWTEHVVNAPLAAGTDRAGSQVVDAQGKPAETHFRVRESGDFGGLAWSLLEATPKTGRTQQIRVHAAHAGLPLLGDVRYGGPAFHTAPDGRRLAFPRVCLHAESLSFRHPDGERRAFERPWGPDLAGILATLAGRPGP